MTALDRIVTEVVREVLERCPVCKGTGREVRVELGSGLVQGESWPCHACTELRRAVEGERGRGGDNFRREHGETIQEIT